MRASKRNENAKYKLFYIYHAWLAPTVVILLPRTSCRSSSYSSIPRSIYIWIFISGSIETLQHQSEAWYSEPEDILLFKFPGWRFCVSNNGCRSMSWSSVDTQISGIGSIRIYLPERRMLQKDIGVLRSTFFYLCGVQNKLGDSAYSIKRRVSDIQDIEAITKIITAYKLHCK